MDNQQERLLGDLSWLSGVWESEGWFSMIKEFRRKTTTGRCYHIQCGICNTDDKFISQVKTVLYKLNIPHYISKPRIVGIGKRPIRQIIIQGFKRTEKFLNVIFPYLRVKDERAKILMDFIEFRKKLPSQKYPYGEYEYSLYEKLKSLNNRKNCKPNNILREHTSNSTSKIDEDVLQTKPKGLEVIRNNNSAELICA